jgi:Flp pilus assembly protein TadD
MGILNKFKKKNTLVIHINTEALKHVDKGNDLARKGKLDEAIKEFNTALEIEPQTSEALYGLGLVCQQRGKLDEAREYYQQAVKADPVNTDAMFNIGAINMWQQRYEEAIEVFELLSILTPEDPQVFLNLGSIYLASGNAEKAVDSLHEALRLDPNYAKAQFLLTKARQQMNQ